jgi:hypothetical protein
MHEVVGVGWLVFDVGQVEVAEAAAMAAPSSAPATMPFA